MKSSILASEEGAATRSERRKLCRRKISAILKAAYHAHGRDVWSRRAVKRVLR